MANAAMIIPDLTDLPIDFPSMGGPIELVAG